MRTLCGLGPEPSRPRRDARTHQPHADPGSRRDGWPTFRYRWSAHETGAGSPCPSCRSAVRRRSRLYGWSGAPGCRRRCPRPGHEASSVAPAGACCGRRLPRVGWVSPPEPPRPAPPTIRHCGRSTTAPARADADPPPRTDADPPPRTDADPPARTDADPPPRPDGDPPARTDADPPPRPDGDPPAWTAGDPPERAEGRGAAGGGGRGWGLGRTRRARGSCAAGCAEALGPGGGHRRRQCPAGQRTTGQTTGRTAGETAGQTARGPVRVHAASRIRSAARSRADAARGLAATSASVGASAPRVSTRSSARLTGSGTGSPAATCPGPGRRTPA